MQIKTPIFIVGAGRSGTPVFYNHFSIHPELSWFSNFSDRFHRSKLVPYFHRLLDIPILGDSLKSKILKKKRIAIRPSEAGTIYHEISGFAHSQKMTEGDRDSVNEELFKETIKHHLSATGKKRFINKQTANTQRLRLLNDIFEDALFIHVIRDGRAVANSLYNVGFWKNIDLWWQGNTEESERDNIELCARHWKKNINEIFDNRSLFDDRYLEIRYEDLGSDFKKEMMRVVEFCDLEKNKEFFDFMPECLPNRNFKWKKNLGPDQKKRMNAILENDLKKLGYL